jgi:hypothetical protein
VTGNPAKLAIALLHLSRVGLDVYRKYWNEIVIPDYDEFFVDLDNLWKTFQCAGSRFQGMERLAGARAPSEWGVNK